MTQAALAKAAGTKQQTISYLVSVEAPATNSKYTPLIARALGVNPVWLATGEGERFDPTVPVKAGGVAAGEATPIPLLPPEQAALYARGEAVPPGQMLITDRVNQSTRAFAVEVRDDSMAPGIRMGDAVIVDCGVEAQPGDYVAATFDGRVILRRYRATRTGFQLAPENSDWETVSSEDGAAVVGVVVEQRSYRRR